MKKPTTIQRILDLLAERPGLRAVEIEAVLDIENASSHLGSAVLRNQVLTENIQAPNGRMVRAFTLNPDYQPHTGNGEYPMQRWIKAPKKSKPAIAVAQANGTDSLVAALFTTGDLVIEVGRKSVRLSATQTRELIAYLDRINVDQVLDGA